MKPDLHKAENKPVETLFSADPRQPQRESSHLATCTGAYLGQRAEITILHLRQRHKNPLPCLLLLLSMMPRQ